MRLRRESMQEKESRMVVRCELKIPTLGITVRLHSASLVMSNSYGIFSQHLTIIKDSYILAPVGFTEIPVGYARIVFPYLVCIDKPFIVLFNFLCNFIQQLLCFLFICPSFFRCVFIPNKGFRHSQVYTHNLSRNVEKQLQLSRAR